MAWSPYLNDVPSTFGAATATGLSVRVDGDARHDPITGFYPNRMQAFKELGHPFKSTALSRKVSLAPVLRARFPQVMLTFCGEIDDVYFCGGSVSRCASEDLAPAGRLIADANAREGSMEVREETHRKGKAPMP